ncbi:major capsid protein [Psychrobacter pygoscelis]|uniref:major capsid protein n=1 Tax=Psychrobacter pygoscelis TaxID=2488563 RepID=UPI00103D38FE|nr:major capsid protein [Psychrobacter pygoscelis]
MAVTVKFKGKDVELLDQSQILFIYDKSLKQDDWVINTFYPNKKRFADKDTVDFGKLETTDLLAPFVTAEAKAVQIGKSGSYSTHEVEAAYLKPARAITPTSVPDAYIESVLIQWGFLNENNVNLGNMSNAEKLRLCQMTNAMLNRTAIDNRKKLMALDVLFKGYTEYQSENYNYYKADFRRDSNMTYRVTTDWDDKSAKVVTDLDTALGRMFDVAGVQPEIILSTSKALNLALKNEEFQERFTKADGSNTPDNTLMPSFMRTKQAKLKGTLDGVEWWVFDAKHTLNGDAEHYVNPKNVYLIADLNGTQCQCQIKHLDVMGAPLDYYEYVDVSKNPSVIQQIADSAPLMAPSMSNGVMTLQVLA